MSKNSKRAFPVYKARQILEPGPTVLVSSAYKDERNVMTMGWHMVMEFTPSLFGCIIASSNHSFEMIRKSGECVINVPTVDLIDKVVAIGNCSGGEVDKFEKFGLTTKTAKKVDVPIIDDCFANFECTLYDKRMVKDYNFFIFEIVAARVATAPKQPKTIHYHGQGIFNEAGRWMDKSKRFTKWRGSPTF